MEEVFFWLVSFFNSIESSSGTKFDISYLNAALLLLLLVVVLLGVKYIVGLLKDQGDSINTVLSDIKVNQQWTVLHQEEDNRRFVEIKDKLVELYVRVRGEEDARADSLEKRFRDIDRRLNRIDVTRGKDSNSD